MSKLEKLELTEERLALHNKLYKPSPETHSRHASQLVEMERIQMSCLKSAIDLFKEDRLSTSSLPIELEFSRTAESLTSLFEKESEPLNKSPLEHPLERYLTPGDLSEPSYFAIQTLKEYGFEYGSHASVDARKRLGRLNYESAKLNARAAQTVNNTCDNRKRVKQSITKR
ncbi:hypothetical protein I7I53_04584 [Histoplasma capsulatum var. duboisii H88]|uniref:Uncharacterized protein n=1 Tax=Ajellomyces capsulatus (strain H88) TaxID=544711 RepID=A0A8A1LQ36_AJEC8|nr:hypothetical protein I7I53_04584 [Histoplasma capsulatum var. duboisii H88]